jgi:hypothetical protein
MYVDSILNYFNNGEEIEFPLINYNELWAIDLWELF